MRNAARRFLQSQNGSFAPLMAIAAVPLLLAVGLATDYSSAVSTRSKMQDALDSATLSLIGMPRTASDSDRQEKLQSIYSANGGHGTAKMLSTVFDADGTLHLSTSADYAMPTAFMSLAMISDVPIDVASTLVKKPRLVDATFKIDKASGYWNKTITLYGSEPDDKNPNGLMQIKYTYNGKGGSKGYGTTTVLTPDKDGKFTVIKQRQVCTTVNASGQMPAGAFRDGNKYTTCTFDPNYGSGAKIDVSKMNDLYLQMDVPSASSSNQPTKLKSNDPKTSNRLYIGNPDIQDGKLIEVAKNQVVDIFRAVPCGKTSGQAWEDGGNEVPADVSNADFFYSVTGKCDFSQLGSDTRLTQ
jgi:Flp pilus assembly protein TadG